MEFFVLPFHFVPCPKSHDNMHTVLVQWSGCPWASLRPLHPFDNQPGASIKQTCCLFELHAAQVAKERLTD